MITNLMITTPQDTPGQIASRKVGQSQILMAAHSCLPGDPDMAGSEAQRAHPCRSLSRFGDFCP